MDISLYINEDNLFKVLGTKLNYVRMWYAPDENIRESKHDMSKHIGTDGIFGMDEYGGTLFVNRHGCVRKRVRLRRIKRAVKFLNDATKYARENDLLIKYMQKLNNFSDSFLEGENKEKYTAKLVHCVLQPTLKEGTVLMGLDNVFFKIESDENGLPKNIDNDIRFGCLAYMFVKDINTGEIITEIPEI